MTSTGLSAGTALVVGAGGVVALLVLYLVGRRAPRIVVSFAGPWLQTPSARLDGRWAHRVRRLGSLALQVATLAAIVVAATALFGDNHNDDNVGPGKDRPGRTIALLIDRSASMQAHDEPGSRMARARTLASDIIAGLGQDDRALVVAFAADAIARTGLEHDRARLAAAVAGIEAGDQPGDVSAAVEFAAALLRGQPRPTVILIGDGGGSGPSEDAGRDLDVRFVPVGQRARNLAIVSFSARRQPGDPSSADLSVVVRSFQDAAADVDLTVTAGPQRIPVAQRHLHLEPHARLVQTLLGVPVAEAHLQARLENTGDDLPLDDRAFAVVPPPTRLSVIAIGPPDLYLDGALLSLGSAVTVERVSPDDTEASRPRWATADVVIFHGVTPRVPTSRSGGRFLYLAPSGPENPWRLASGGDGDVRDPVVAGIVRDHPLVRGLSLADLNVLGARRLVAGPADTVVVAAADRAPLLLARDGPRARAVALAFDPRRSDLPMRSAFPLLLANALTWLAQRPEPQGLSWPTGRTVQLDLPDGAATGAFEIHGSDGSLVATVAAAGAVRVTLDRVGVFTVVNRATGQIAARVAANLASADESNLVPRSTMRIGARVLARPDRHRQRPHAARGWRCWR